MPDKPFRDKRLSLADLKQKLRIDAAPAKPRPAVSPIKQASTTQLDDAQLFRQAVAGSKALPSDNRAKILRPLPPPVPRAQDSALTEESSESLRPDPDLPASWFNDVPTAVTSAEEAAIAVALKGVTRITTDKVTHDLPKPHPIARQSELDEQAALVESIYAPTSLELRMEGGDELLYLRDNLPRNVVRDLRRGRWVVQGELDLHGANRDQARDMLAAFIAQCRKNDVRCVRIIHGKGLGSPGREPVLKKLVAGWLMNYDDVMAYAQARVHDGGAGALLVLLRAARR